MKSHRINQFFGRYAAFLLRWRWVVIALFALSTLFSFVTLPVEIDASRRALAWLNQSDIIDPSTEDEARGALRAAAYTYVVAALSALATLIYYLSIFSGRRS